MIYVECNTDEFFFKTMGVPRKKLRHENGKSRVVARVVQGDDRTGIIDEDPGYLQPQQLSQYEVMDRISGIGLLHNRRNDNRFIVISPNLETWLIKIARNNSIKPSEYNLPNDSDKLHEINPFKRGNYGRFLSRIAASDDREVRILKEWIGEAVQ